MKNKRISKFIIPIIALISIAGITTFVSACKPSKDDNNISDEDFTVSKINDFDYDNYATSHRPMDFANLNPNSDAVINYFKNNYHQGDLLNTVAKYIHLILEYTQVTTLDNESSTTLNGVINESTSKLIVQYINQKGEGNFAL
jgi:hypothetical protein